MKFTLVFDTPEHMDASYGLVFIPSPQWVRGEREVALNPTATNTPHYVPGLLRTLLDTEEFERAGQRVVVVVHEVGNGSPDDLKTLLQDLREEGFDPVLAHMQTPN